MITKSKTYPPLMHLEAEVLFTRLCQSLTNHEINSIHRLNRNTGQFGGTADDKIEEKTAHKLPEFSLCDFRTSVVSIFINHFRSYHTLISALLPKPLTFTCFRCLVDLVRYISELLLSKASNSSIGKGLLNK